MFSTEETTMRVLAIATIFLLSSAVVPSVAQQGQSPNPAPPESQVAPAPGHAGTTTGQAQTQAAPAQPERTPQQSEQARKEDHDRDQAAKGEGQRMGGMNRDDMASMMAMCQRMMGRMDRGMHRDDFAMDRDEDNDDRDSYRDDRTPRRVKICIEEENGDEYCHYRHPVTGRPFWSR